MNGATYNYAYWPTPGGGTLLNTSASINYYMHKDWLGNARLVSTVPNSGGGTVTTDRAFAPYGEVYDIFGSTEQNQISFTGLTQDVFSGMYDTPNRELQGAQQGRWLSPDPARAGWNQYAYATNPLNSVDPSGLACYPLEKQMFASCAGFLFNGVNFGGNWNPFTFIMSTTLCEGGDCSDYILRTGLNFVVNAWNSLNGALGITRPSDAWVSICQSQGMTAGTETCFKQAALIWSGHGYFNPADGTVTVPQGTSVTVWTGQGNQISIEFGVAIDTGADLSQFTNEMTGAQTYLPGSQMPNYTLDSPTGLSLLGNTNTVSGPTTLDSILQENMGNIQWSACCEEWIPID